MTSRVLRSRQADARNRVAAVLLAVAGPLAIGSCGVGEDAPTLQVRPDHPSGDLGPVAVRSLMLLAPPGGGEAAAVVTLVNDSDETQTLERVQIGPLPDGSGSSIDIPAGIRVPARAAVNVGAADQPALPISGLEQLAAPGTSVPVTLMFDKAGELTLQVVVREATGAYESFLPSPSPGGVTSPTAPPIESPSPSPTPTS